MLYVHSLPILTTPQELAGGVVVVIDVLRASTTITHALVAGATCVVPCLEIEDARSTAARLAAAGPVVLGGERGGLPIPGFELGNSPNGCTPESVGGKTLVFTTTNGTLAMERCRQADRVFVGSFVNRMAVAGRLQAARAAGRSLHLLCAGTGGKVTREDVLFAGSLVDLLVGAEEESWDLNDQAILAGDAWRQALSRGARESTLNEIVARELRRTQGGRNLKRIGLDADIHDAAQLDRFEWVPELSLAEWTIRAAV